jgi:hypothetical protein
VGVFQTRILTQTLTPIRGPLSVPTLDRAWMTTNIRISRSIHFDYKNSNVLVDPKPCKIGKFYDLPFLTTTSPLSTTRLQRDFGRNWIVRMSLPPATLPASAHPT